MAKKVQTFGYEGLTIQQFVTHLQRSRTQIVVDVRANPLSRKPGFSKKSLAAHLEAAGIRYRHAVGVGCPKPVRDRYRADNDWSVYTKGYLTYLKGRADDIAAIAEVASQSIACLVCFEADHERCHRSFVADAVAAKSGLTIQHLSLRKGTFDFQSPVAA